AFESLEGLVKLPMLTDLYVYDTEVSSLKGIGDVPRLRHLRLEMADKLRSLDGLEACESLESVLVSTSRDATFGVNDIGALHEVATLTDLELPGADVSDLRPLS